ncbi:hypothetical protein ASA1KI_24400 [Opitutales bacterium ASA1]|nr:hypothetical protein ASA1KI_24400 [Opitutales bacterium ASA1]
MNSPRFVSVLLAGVLSCSVFDAAVASSLPDGLVERAVREDAPRWKFVDARRYREMPQTFALHVTAVAAHLAPESVVDGETLARHLAAKLRWFLVTPEPYEDGSTREPEAQGGLGGWTHAHAALSLLLAKRTPEVWTELSADERHRADVLMRALAVAAHFCLDDDNEWYLLLDGESLFHRSWNPNHVEGYAGVIVAASLYFGADELNTWFAAFDFVRFTAELERLNFRNIHRCWTRNPAMGRLLEHGGTIAVPAESRIAAGVLTTGAGVRNAFTLDGVPLARPWDIHRGQALRLYARAVRTPVRIHESYTAGLLQRRSTANASPWEGLMGMCLEFESTDWSGMRSSLLYAFEGVMIDVPIAAALRVLGEWRHDEGGDVVERRMAVGMADLRFKAHEGHRGWANGAERIATWEDDLEPMGASYVFGLWEALFAGPPDPLSRDAGD